MLFTIDMEKTRITVLTTGGTIEKTYDEVEGSIGNKESVIKESILSKIRLPHTNVDVKYIMNKDSLEMDDQDREIILQAIRRFASYGNPLIIIHGTDTMSLSAKYCFEKNPKIEVPVIFTGAMKPLGFSDSDAFQNTIEALAVAKVLPAGYYISFHNQVFEVPNVEKDKQLRTFVKT